MAAHLRIFIDGMQLLPMPQQMAKLKKSQAKANQNPEIEGTQMRKCIFNGNVERKGEISSTSRQCKTSRSFGPLPHFYGEVEPKKKKKNREKTFWMHVHG